MVQHVYLRSLSGRGGYVFGPFHHRGRLTLLIADRLLSLIAHVAASLPFKKGDELLTLIFQIDAIVARRGDDVVASFGDAVKQSEQVGADGARNEGLKVGPQFLAQQDTPDAISCTTGQIHTLQIFVLCGSVLDSLI